MSAAINKAQQLLRDAKLGRVVRVDLERGLMTVTLPDGFQISKAPIALIPAAQAQEAATQEAGMTGMAIFGQSDEPHSFRVMSYMDGGYEVRHQGAEYTVYRDYTLDKNKEKRRHAYWVGYIERTDLDGLSWSARIPSMLINDYGVLVPVPRGLA